MALLVDTTIVGLAEEFADVFLASVRGKHVELNAVAEVSPPGGAASDRFSASSG